MQVERKVKIKYIAKTFLQSELENQNQSLESQVFFQWNSYLRKKTSSFFFPYGESCKLYWKISKQKHSLYSLWKGHYQKKCWFYSYLICRFSAVSIKVPNEFLHGNQQAEKKVKNNPGAPEDGRTRIISR